MALRIRDRRKSLVALVLALGGFVAQTELTHQVLIVRHFNHPFFVTYVTQSVFTASVLVHLIYLVLSAKSSISKTCNGLKLSIERQLLPDRRWDLPSERFPYARLVVVALSLTIGFTVPTLAWGVAISLSPTSDVTVLWNTNPVFAYLISVTLLGRAHHPKKFIAVVLATSGVVPVVYGSANFDNTSSRLPSRLTGDLVALFSSISFAGYQLFYDSLFKRPSAVTAPPDPEEAPLIQDNDVQPPPFGLESSFWTSTIGLSTFTLLWVAFPFLHHFGLEESSLPDSPTMWLILAAAASGATFMTGTMMLLASWGAIQVSVTSLLTTVLVFLTDFLLGARISYWSVAGSLIIMAAWGLILTSPTGDDASWMIP